MRRPPLRVMIGFAVRNTVATLVVVALLGSLLLAIDRHGYPDVHTILDTGMALLSAVLALLFWDSGVRIDRPFPRWLAVSFALTALLEALHLLTTIQWSGPLEPLARAAGPARATTWLLAAYVLPVGIGGALWLKRRGARQVRGLALGTLGFAVALAPVYLWLPRYTAPLWLGITRPGLGLVPVLWAAMAVVSWRQRATDRVLPALAGMAVVLFVGHGVMLYSTSIDDAAAMIAHLGKVCGYLLLLLSVMQMASTDSLARLRAEQKLARANEELELRVAQRTAALERANQSLLDENVVRQRAEDLLRESQQLLQSVIDNSPAVIYVKDLGGRYLLGNRRFCELFHVNPEALRGRTDHQIFAPEVADAFRAMDQRVAAAGVALTEEESAPHDDGPHAYLSVKCPLRGADGRVYAVFGISTDITDRKRAEERLRASEERTRLIIEAALDAVITIDSAGVITGWSPQAEATFGWAAGEVIGRSLAQTIIPARYRELHERGMRRYLDTGEAVVLNRRIELSALHHNGAEFPIELAITPLRTGETIEFSAFVRDITERKRAEAALAASERHYRLLFEHTPLPKWIYDTQTLQILAVNKAAQDHYGYTEEEFLRLTIRDIRPPEDLPALEADVELAKHGRSGSGEWRHRKKDGTLIHVIVNAHDLVFQERRARMVLVQDITERKEAERRVQAQLARLDLLHRITRAIGDRQDLQSIYQVAVRTLEDHLAIDLCCIGDYDPADHTLVVNRIGVRSQKLAAELGLAERSRMPVDENGLARCVRGHLVYEADVSEAKAAFPQRLAAAGLRALVIAPLVVESKVFGVMIAARCAPRSFSSGECEFLRQVNEHVALAAHQAQLYSALQAAYEELRQTQQSILQQERLRALGQMASGIAHDINNAISPAALYTEALLEREANLTPAGRDQLQTIQHALEDVAQTVARMREFYRHREPQVMLMPVDLNALVEQVVELTRARWHDMPQQRGLVIEQHTELAPDLPLILGIESDIREALINLVFNAVDAMPDGGRLTLRTRTAETVPADRKVPAQRVARIEVSDTGVGMSDDTRRRCLEPFFTTKGERGTGLGLPMVYGMVQRHNADIHIASALGRGTTVSVTFAVPTVAPATPSQPAEVPAPRRRLRLLVVDDDPLLIRSLRDTLEADGHVVVTAHDGRAGINTFHAAQSASEPFAAVITDLGMPYVDGKKVAAEVKAASPATPVIMLTGWGQRLAAEGEIPPHVDRLLSKPPKLRDLRLALAELTGASVDRPGSAGRESH